jgi:hypothetical protein
VDGDFRVGGIVLLGQVTVRFQSVMDKITRLNTDHRADLVAYLDGELPDGQARAIDQILAGNQVARHEVEALARTWELLDALPVFKASKEFDTRTMTALKLGDVKYEMTSHPWFRYIKRGTNMVVWMLVLGISGYLGFRLTSTWIPNPQEQILQDLDLLQTFDSYQEIQTVDFLIRLKQIGLFDSPPQED